MRTLVLNGAYERLKTRCESPSELLAELNDYLVGEFPDGDLHCSACCIDVRPDSNGAEVTHANAGCVPLYVLSSQNPPAEHYAEGPLLGVDYVAWPEPTRFRLEPGQLLVVASDGLTEQPNRQQQRFDSRLLGLDVRFEPEAGGALGKLLAEFESFLNGQPVADDVTVVVLALPALSHAAGRSLVECE
jgi:serine phosphatase RsbU (regulator of sigma subunit)